MKLNYSRIEFLSWPLSPEMIGYGGAAAITAEVERSMERGDSNNTLRLGLTTHSGTHVDAPFHFVPSGKSIDAYSPEELFFHRVQVIEIPLSSGRLIRTQDLERIRPETGADCLLMRTGFCDRRSSQAYALDGPGLDRDAASLILRMWPSLACLGVDFISINRWSEREVGREAHRALLGKPGFLIVEDMDLRKLGETSPPASLQVCPLRIAGGDGAPATIVAYFGESGKA